MHDHSMTIAMTSTQMEGPLTTDEPVAAVDGIVKRYGTTEVVRGVSFSVRRGELFGLLGTNGAGKTTTVEILQGLRRADSGSVRVLGLDPAVGRGPVAPTHRCPTAECRAARPDAGR